MQPKQHRQSKLRNEVHRHSTDDKRDLDETYVQVPDSDILIPETQPVMFDKEQSHLSPNSQAILDKTAVPRTRTTKERTPPVFGLSKQLLQRHQEDIPQFTFAHARLAVPKAAAKKEVMQPKAMSELAVLDVASQPAIEIPANVVTIVRKDRSYPEAKSPQIEQHTKRNSPKPKGFSKPVVMQKDPEVVSQAFGICLNAEIGVTEPTPPELYRTESPQSGQFGTAGAAQLETNHAIPPSTKAGSSVPAVGQPIRSGAKKGKKSRKIQPARYRDGLWPPRSLQETRSLVPAEPLNNDQPVLDVIPPTFEYPVLENQYKSIGPNPEECAPMPVDTQGDLSINREQYISRNAEEQVVSTRVADLFKQGECLGPNPGGQNALPYDSQNPINVSQSQQTTDTPEEHLALRTNMLDNLQNTNEPAREVSNKSEGPNNFQNVPLDKPVHFAKDRPVDESLRGVSSRAGPSRVSKPQKKKRNNHAVLPDKSMPVIAHGDGLPLALDHMLESVRMVVSTDRARSHSDHTSEINAHQGNIAALQEIISLQKHTILALKNKDATMRTTMNRHADTVGKLKKYVEGLETDHAKIKASVEIYHRECDESWKEKVDEVTAEKAELEREFLAMINAVNKSRQSMQTAMVECYHELELSEDKRITLVQDLRTMHALLEVEQKRSAGLEQQIISSLQAIHNHLDENNNSVIKKLGGIQSLVEDTTADDKRDTCLKECIETLKNLRATPFLTAKDTQKAEKMLRYLQETIDSKFGILSRSMNAKEFPSKDVENYIYDQLQNLRTEILKYDEVSTECETVRQTNAHLTLQLQAQNEHHEKLDARVKSLLQSEAGLKSRYAQLEIELNTLKNMSCDRVSKSSDPGQEEVALRSHLRKAEEDLQAALDKLNKIEEVSEKERSDVARWKTLAEENEAKLAKAAKSMKKLEKDKESLTHMRARIEKECYKIVEEKTAQWENNLHCVTFEKDEKGKALKEVSQELDGTRVQLQRIQQQLHNAESEASTLRKDKTALESKFKQAQRTILESSIASSDLAALTEQLEEKDEILKTKEKEFNTMRQDYDDLQGQITALHESVKRFEAQISEHKSTIESERQKSIAQLSESRKKEETAVQEAHNQITELKREKQDVELCWHRSRSSENLLRDMQSRTSCELEGLRAELVKVSNAKEATEEDIRRIREAADEELKTLEAEHRKETRDFQHRLTQAEAVLKESKAKIKHLMDEKDQFFETHKKVAEQRVRPKLANDDKQTFCLEELLDVESHQQTPISRNAPAMTLNNTLFDSRRQFNRQTSSVAGTEQLSHTRTRVTAGGVKSGSIVNREVELAHPFEGVDASMAIDLGTQERLGPDGVSILEPVPEPVPETQVQVPTLSFKDNNQISVRTEQNRGGSTSSLSDPRSDLFDDLFHTRASTPTGSQHLNGSRAPTKLSIQATSYQTPRRPVKTSMHDSRSFDRPKSQANTASRMKPPPPPNQVDYLDQDRQEPAFDAAPMRSQHNSSHRDNKASNHVPSSPEFLHRTPSTAKMTYGHHAGRPITFGAIRRDSVSRGLDQSSSQKRKSPAKHAGSDTPAKRHRQLSQSIPPSSLPSTLPRDHEGRARGYPGVTQRSQGLKRTSRKKTGSRDHRYETRFAEELKH